MPDNTGLLLLGLGALLFLGRGGIAKIADKDERYMGDLKRLDENGITMQRSPGFNIQSYIDGLFGETATVDAQPKIYSFFPAAGSSTSSGVTAVVPSNMQIITPTTKVAIGGDGGETITASSLEIIRSEQIARQEFAAAANADFRTAPKDANYFYAATLEANRLEEARQKAFADNLIKKYRADQAKTREEAEKAVEIKPVYRQPTINIEAREIFDETDDDDYTINYYSEPGQSISISSDVLSVEVEAVDFSSEGVGDEFVISGGMSSPTVFHGEEDDTFSVGAVSRGGAYYGEEDDE